MEQILINYTKEEERYLLIITYGDIKIVKNIEGECEITFITELKKLIEKYAVK